MSNLLKRVETNSDFPIKVENHPENYKGYDFITLIRFNDESNIIIVDNVFKRYIDAYCLDLCKPFNINEELIIAVALKWYSKNSNNYAYPLSIEFSKMGLSSIASKIMKTYPVDHVSRIIGPVVPQFYMGNPERVRKRKRRLE